MGNTYFNNTLHHGSGGGGGRLSLLGKVGIPVLGAGGMSLLGKVGIPVLGAGGMSLLGVEGIELSVGVVLDGVLASEHLSSNLERFTFSLARVAICPRYRVSCAAYCGPAALFIWSIICIACPQFWAHRACRSWVFRSVWDKLGDATASWIHPMVASRLALFKALSFMALNFGLKNVYPEIA
jgi:hypothetical protein